MKVKKIEGMYSIYQVKDIKEVNFTSSYVFVSKTKEEVSVVSLSSHMPKTSCKYDDNYVLFMIDELLDFSLVGVLDKISSLLANIEVSIFVVSTYNTDYFLVKNDRYKEVINELVINGYEL